MVQLLRSILGRPQWSALSAAKTTLARRSVSSASSSSSSEADVVVEYLDGDQAGIVVLGLNRPKVIDENEWFICVSRDTE